MAYSNDPKRLMARIHIAKSQLGMDDDVYRQLLKDLTGKDSCGAMSANELMKIDHAMQQRGFKPKRKTNSKKSPSSRNKGTKTRVDKIRAIWITMHKEGILRNGSEQALQSWVKRSTVKINNGVGIDRVDWLGQNDLLAHRVLESLKQWQKRALREKIDE